MNDLDQSISKALDECTENLDAASLSRLKQVRVKALEQPQRWWRGAAGRWLSAGAATGTALTLGIYMALSPVTTNTLPGASLNELEIATLDEDMELLEEMDFYHWLEITNPDGGNT